MSWVKETGRTVRFAIARERRTARLISILVTVGVIALVLIAAANGASVTVG
ncbi:hypothetical protein ACFVFT_08800 [Streptomyces tendae]|uniref:hypothetical protein n=1 Tax=Streptomyces TaxID=1883 RepID=UPI0018DA2AD1|nr:hypothetical protein [Streptomyces sp. HB-N217]MBH5131780.1 hypothetical protein [Streptomyces sp. HB-N217]